jgi:hypothetical protein
MLPPIHRHIIHVAVGSGQAMQVAFVFANAALLDSAKRNDMADQVRIAIEAEPAKVGWRPQTIQNLLVRFETKRRFRPLEETG